MVNKRTNYVVVYVCVIVKKKEMGQVSNVYCCYYYIYRFSLTMLFYVSFLLSDLLFFFGLL